LDDGRLTDGRGRVVNFKNTIIIMTSNIGNEIISELSGKDDTKLKLEMDVLLRKAFKPEFLNRIDQTVIFNPLSPKIIKDIVEIQLQLVAKRLAKKQIKLEFTSELKSHLAEAGYDPIYGARPLKRVIQDEILDELALNIIEHNYESEAQIKIDFVNGKVKFSQPN
jgi:ATP-dependent Clp protease ATP-binding subunit ClpB